VVIKCTNWLSISCNSQDEERDGGCNYTEHGREGMLVTHCNWEPVGTHVLLELKILISVNTTQFTAPPVQSARREPRTTYFAPALCVSVSCSVSAKDIFPRIVTHFPLTGDGTAPALSIEGDRLWRYSWGDRADFCLSFVSISVLFWLSL
jgi:hypothetical protein